MRDFDNPKDKIKRLMREAVPEASNVADFAAAARRRGRPVAKATPVLKITGNNSAGIIGNHNQVNITVKAPTRTRVRVEVPAGPGSISEAQAAEIQALVAKVVSQSGKTFPQVWGALKRRYRFAQYRHLPAGQFDDVYTYLRKWIASTSGRVATSPESARKKALARIHAEANKRGLLDNVHCLAGLHFDTEDLGALTTDQLHELIAAFKF